MGDQRKVAWLTGANRGMGAATAVELARAGFDVAITARDQQRLDATAAEVVVAGGRALALASDLTDRVSMNAFADAAVNRFGRCDVLCNIGIHKGPGMTQRFLDTSLDEFAISFEADVIAAALLCQRAVPLMLAEGGGVVVNMSTASVFLEPSGPVGENGWSISYVAAKAAIDQFASILNVELGARGIRAFTVEPGFVAYGDKLAQTIAKYPGIPVSPPEAIGCAITWLVQSPDADRFLSKRVNLPGLTHKFGLLPGWDGPGSHFRRPGAPKRER
jgi:NAD(P)-dependent dehydrogenase (short-subunit alcohol dehydrogenase family)